MILKLFNFFFQQTPITATATNINYPRLAMAICFPPMTEPVMLFIEAVLQAIGQAAGLQAVSQAADLQAIGQVADPQVFSKAVHKRLKGLYEEIAAYHDDRLTHENDRDLVQAQTFYHFLGAKGVLIPHYGNIFQKHCFPGLTDQAKIEVINKACKQMGLKLSGLLFAVIKLKMTEYTGNQLNSDILKEFYPLFEQVIQYFHPIQITFNVLLLFIGLKSRRII